MKTKNHIWYTGYAISGLLLVIQLLTNFNTGLIMLTTIIFSVSHVQLLHNKMLCTDSSYKTECLDERNITIREKAGSITNLATLVLLSCAAALFIALNYIIPAIAIAAIIFIQPIIFILITNSIEKKM